MGSFFYQVGPPNKAGRTEPGTPPPTVAKPPGRLHQVGIKALQSGVSYHLRELDSHEERASGLLQAGKLPYDSIVLMLGSDGFLVITCFLACDPACSPRDDEAKWLYGMLIIDDEITSFIQRKESAFFHR